jgi:hypothetical protein
MKKLISLAFSALLGINAWCYENTAATFTWTVGNESAAAVASDAADGVKATKLSAGSALTVGMRDNLKANEGVPMVTFTPATNKPGTVSSAMVEYSVTMKKGITFSLTNIDYDAIKQGTDGASYHWAYAVDGEEYSLTEVTQDELLRDNNTSGTPALHHSHEVTAEPGQKVSVRFYVSGFNAGKYFCLSNIQLTGVINGEEEIRAFTDFKIEFRDNPYTVILPESGVLPDGVLVEGTSYNGGQHGVQGGTITVPVDGPVKFTIGACQYSKADIAISKNGDAYASLSNAAPCGEQKPNYNQFVTWTYNVEEAATLTFELGSQTYLPYFFAEACDFVPQVEVRYYDTDGKTLIGSEIVEGGSVLEYKYGPADVTVAEGKAFRGWFNDTNPTATKVAAGISLTEDISLYAKATEIEVAALGAIFDYDFRKNYFYPEDHELLTLNGGRYNDGQHGWAFSNGNSISIEVAGNALLIVGVCTYSNTAVTEIKDAEGTKVGELNVTKNTTPDGEEQSVYYKGPATTLTFNFTTTSYIHFIKVYNVSSLPEKSETGYYILDSGDAASLILVLGALQPGDKIFLPNGVYDLGETVLTTISKNNISIIGQSMEGTIIRNAPDAATESIDKTATIKINKNVSGTYLQDLTIQNALDYYKNNNGRAVALWDQGTQTVCKNVRLLSYQDTYYSNLQGAVKYFEDCEIHGTVDFICGDGSVYFKNNLLYAEKRNTSGTGSDALTANNGPASDRGYVFEGCTIKSECPVVSFGRAWNNTPSTAFLNTIVDYSEGEFSFSSTDGKVQRWTKELMNANAWPKFGEFNTRLMDGTLLTPESNVVKFLDSKGGNATQDIETVLGADQAAQYTINYTLGNWAETALNDATQADCEAQATELEPDAIYMAECEGKFVMLLKGSEFFDKLALYDGKIYTLRKANARGGFGAAAEASSETRLNAVTTESKTKKYFRDGQLIIVRDNQEYNVLGGLVQ